MIQFILFSTLAVLTAAQSTVYDTPRNNFTQDLVELPGPLVVPTAELLSHDKSHYEGRWYAVYFGVKRSQAKDLSCIVFDSFFDNDGNYHLFFNIKDNGETRISISVKKPDKPEEGIYDLYLGQPESQKMKGVLYYIDKDMIALWNGMKGKDKHYQELIIGFRNLKSVSKKTAEIERIYSSLVKKGAPCEKVKISQKKCEYPEVMQDPYKSE